MIPDIIRKKWLNVLILIILFIWIFSLFVVPFTIKANSVRYVNGHSTFLDNMEKWEKLPVYQKIIYQIGDILCHQYDERSFILNSNQTPVCVRCIAIYIGLFLGIFYTLFIPNNINHKEYLFYILPFKTREFLIKRIGIKFLPILLIILFLLPVAVDGLIQLFSSYESNNFLRIITGLPAGSIGGILLGSLINT
jgi:uncharacterized membrane protein